MKTLYFKNIQLTILLTALLFIAGCENFLSEEHPSEVTTDFLYSTPEGLASAINGLYIIERNQLNESESNYFAMIIGDGGTDIDFNRASEADVTRYRLDIDLSTRASIRSWWQKWYRIIERSNSIIAFGEDSDIDEKTKESILREAYLYRAYAYFWLVRKFENIWLNTEPTTYENIDGRTYNVAKQEDVYRQIVADLDKSIEYYNNDWKVIPGKMNLGVAHLLRADVAMWLKDYETAVKNATKIISEGPFALVNPDQIFTADRRNNTKEAMYVMQFDEFAAGGGTGHRLANIFTTQYRSVPGCISAKEYGSYGWTRIHPNPYLIGLYDQTNDKRWNAWWQHYYKYNDPNYDFSKLKYQLGDTLKVGQNSSLTGDNYYRNANISCKKYWDYIRDPLFTRSFNNIYMFRYSTVYLLASEAYMRLGDQTNALKYINILRQNRIAASSGQLLTQINEDIILEENARELALEGHRWFLLKRMGKLVERVKLYGGVTSFRGIPSPNPLYYSCRTNIQDFHVRWPIPQVERDAMGGFPQNSGYPQ